ncbi:MAG: AMIN domain-containing protein [Porticoccaceae bacterium]|jgi:N-acetylmuramoyl-L-alanine amidase|nr:AMIN domain-containing protein [Porticoccaceae bacterium]MBT4210301.1 AMIN domain-containing protein [Porticoccaceae bacterium]MBT4591656.1 AMIN domain-containing protein [Porticoccaceae bacterium]MBT5103858.1 AMIN domain-containing protein [Porticoccaceae bacterium]MBT6027298.1 AMIN domain-containing protein [Porticoccaceae bacterium]
MVALMLLMATPVIGSDIESVRLWHSPDYTRLVIDLSEAAEHQLITLKNPDRLVIDLVDVDLKTTLEKLDLSKTPIAAIRHAARNKTDLRIVLDLNNSVSPKSFTLKANEKYGNRLVVDLYGKAKSVSKTVDKILERKNRKIIIAIDAGHGGEDPGALGPKKVLEKTVALQISKKIEKLFDQNTYFEGVLIRTGDYYVGHRKRMAIAHKKGADFFISVHADAFTDLSVNGASVYALSTKGATSEAARYLASKENRADLIGGASTLSLDDKDDVLAGVLLDLSMNETLRRSLEAGKYVLNSMGRVIKLHKKRVEQASFLVLKSPDIPSLLVETGYISNPREAGKLSSESHQRKIAQAIFDGLVDYYTLMPPVGTLLASSDAQQKRTYVIAPGDTLSEIAQRYNTSVSKILRYNNLASSSIRVGQKISIPPS